MAKCVGTIQTRNSNSIHTIAQRHINIIYTNYIKLKIFVKFYISINQQSFPTRHKYLEDQLIASGVACILSSVALLHLFKHQLTSAAFCF